MSPVIVDGRSLSLEAIERVAQEPATDIVLDDDARARMQASRDVIEKKIASGERVYGVTTGFGRLADVSIAPEDRTALQHNLVRSHASGMGFLSHPDTRVRVGEKRVIVLRLGLRYRVREDAFLSGSDEFYMTTVLVIQKEQVTVDKLRGSRLLQQALVLPFGPFEVTLFLVSCGSPGR